MREDLSSPQDLNNQSPSIDLNTSSSSQQALRETTTTEAVSGDIFGLLIFGLVGLLVVIGVGVFLYRWWRYQAYLKSKSRDRDQTVFVEVAVPKETAEEVQKDRAGGSTTDKDMIAQGEQIFGLLSEYAKSESDTWWSKGSRFSFEIISIDQEIRFWVVCHKDMAEVIEKQIVGLYPKANISRLKKMNFFKENTVTYAQELKLSKRYELPFKTYQLINGDTLNYLTNAMGGLTTQESAAIQLVLTPIKDDWQKSPREIAARIQQGQNPQDVLFPKTDGAGKWVWGFVKAIGEGFLEIGKSFFESSEKKEENPFDKKKEDRSKMDLSGKFEQIQLTPQQQELLKKLEEKASRSGFIFTLRVVASSITEQRAKQIVENIIPAFQVFDIKPFNWFQKVDTKQDEAIVNFLQRSHNYRKNYGFKDAEDIINTEEACSLWHIPNYLVNTANIRWLRGRKPPIPLEIPGPEGDNTYIGTAQARGQSKDVYIKTEDRFRHVYSLGGSGSGKSVLMGNIILQDIENGHGVCVVDPHGETIDEILLRIPESRIDNVVLFSPAITDRPLGLNMLEFDPRKPTQKTLVIDTLFAIWDKLYDLKKTGGPMFENYMKNSMRLVMSHVESGSTLMEIPKVLVDEDFRSFKLAMCDEQEVVDFWDKQATKAGGEASLENMVPYITAKLAPFLTNDFIRPMIGQQKSAINFRTAMDNKKIVLVKLEKGLIGEQSAYLVGMVLVGSILLAGMGRNDRLKYNEDGSTTEIMAEERAPFFVYIDEMQNFLFDAIPKALEEIRKYRVGFYLAHQFIKQVVVQGDERIKDSIMANCATKFIFRSSADDAGYLEKTFAPHLSLTDIISPERFTYNAILLVDGQQTTPFNINSLPLAGQIDPQKRHRIIEMTKQKYGRDRAEVEKEIKNRTKLLF
jgi:hypothetical protein